MRKFPSEDLVHDIFAYDYDSLSLQLENHAHEIIFGLVFEYTNPGDKLLDLGIGTGLGSYLFHKAGLSIYGLDNSKKMLDICRKKDISQDLKLFDMKESHLPYDDQLFDQVISVGVFHFFQDLDRFFKETHRTLKEGGIFSFTVKDSDTLVSREVNEEYDMVIYGHSKEYVTKLSQKYDFKILKSLNFTSFKDLSKKESLSFKAYVLEK